MTHPLCCCSEQTNVRPDLIFSAKKNRVFHTEMTFSVQKMSAGSSTSHGDELILYSYMQLLFMFLCFGSFSIFNQKHEQPPPFDCET